MTVRNLLRNIMTSISLAPAVRTATATATGSAVDLRGYDSAVISVQFGSYTDGTHTPSVQHSVDGTTYTSVAAGDLDGAFAAVNSAAGAGSIQSVGYIGAQRYVRVVMTIASATSGAASGAVVTVGHARSAPTV